MIAPINKTKNLILNKKWIILVLMLVNEVSSERSSGIYVDNGYDQTIIHRVITQRERREVEHEILNLLGLPDRPKTLHYGRKPQVRRSAPKFLLDIYKNALDNDNEHSHTTKAPDQFGLTGQDLRAIDQSDVIMTFAAHS